MNKKKVLFIILTLIFIVVIAINFLTGFESGREVIKNVVKPLFDDRQNTDSGDTPLEKPDRNPVSNPNQLNSEEISAGGGGGGGSDDSSSQSSGGGGSVPDCTIEDYRGTCKIDSITQTFASQNQVLLGVGGVENPDDEGFEVLFEFENNNSAAISVGKQSLLINGNIYPNQLYLNLYSIQSTSEFSCEAIPQTYGDCSVTSFDIGGIDLNDDSMFTF